MRRLLGAVLLMTMSMAVTASEWEFDYDSEFVADHLKYAPYVGSEHSYVECVGFEDDYSVSSLTIPQVVNHNGQTYRVVSIGEGAFYNSQLVSVTVPESVTYICSVAFAAATMRDATIRSSQLTIEMAAFVETLSELHLSAMVPPVIDRLFILDMQTYQPAENVNIYVPQGSLNYYLAADYWSGYTLLEEGGAQSEKVVLDIQSEKGGMLGRLIREQTPDWRTAVSLTVSGAMNADDIRFVRDSLPRLKSLDMTFALVRELPKSAFSNARFKSVRLPLTLESIGFEAFANCASLDTVIVNEGVSTIEESAFSLCNSLKFVRLPSTLQSIGGGAIFVYNMNGGGDITVECDAFFPPSASSAPFTSLGSNIIVKVPAISEEYYREASAWKFQNIEAADIMPQCIVLQEPRTLSTDNLPQGYSPVLLFDAGNYSYGPYGSLTLDGSTSFKASALHLYSNLYYDRNYSDVAASTLLLNTALSADEVIHDITLLAGQWYFISFPFDVRLSDVRTGSDVRNWVVRSYSSVNRANGISNQWTDVQPGTTLKANQGYIWFLATDDSDNDYGYGNITHFSVTSSNTSESAIFCTDDVSVPLSTYAATYAHNCNWNLVGNPYQTYFDISFLDQKMPVIIWDQNRDTYKTYSPVDDDFILRPNQPMFLQKPDGVETLTFKSAGRQISDEKRSNIDEDEYGGSYGNDYWNDIVAGSAPSRGQARRIYNFSISSGDYMDGTRVVLNDAASLQYDKRSDAVKFFSSNYAVPQLYTLVDGIPCSLNERALTDGHVTMGVRASGTGPCIISMERGSGSVLLKDNVTGAVVDLREENYTFTSAAGQNDCRFVLSFGETTSAEAVRTEEDGRLYDISGRNVESPSANGIYIRDGKKFFDK